MFPNISEALAGMGVAFLNGTFSWKTDRKAQFPTGYWYKEHSQTPCISIDVAVTISPAKTNSLDRKDYS